MGSYCNDGSFVLPVQHDIDVLKVTLIKYLLFSDVEVTFYKPWRQVFVPTMWTMNYHGLTDLQVTEPMLFSAIFLYSVLTLHKTITITIHNALYEPLHYDYIYVNMRTLCNDEMQYCSTSYIQSHLALYFDNNTRTIDDCKETVIEGYKLKRIMVKPAPCISLTIKFMLLLSDDEHVQFAPTGNYHYTKAKLSDVLTIYSLYYGHTTVHDQNLNGMSCFLFPKYNTHYLAMIFMYNKVNRICKFWCRFPHHHNK